MPVATEKVTDRRPLLFNSFDELIEEVKRIVRAEEQGALRTTGNWSAGQIMQHIGKAMAFSMDGFPFKAPLPIRLIAATLKRLMWKPTQNMLLKPGFQLPTRAAPMLPADMVPVSEGAAFLLAQIARAQGGTPMTHPHPVIGALTNEQATELHLRHAANHLSFIHYEMP